MLLLFGVMTVVLMIPRALGGFVHAVCQADNMTYLVEQWAMNLLIYLLQRFLWPSCNRFLFNTYRGYAFLLLKISDEMLHSRERVIQGDPLSMIFYSVATLLLVRALKGDGR